ncbi:hypothetical protein BGZ97_010323, partial [Linnemannia gamsii]
MINKVNISDPVGLNPNPKPPSTGSDSQDYTTAATIGGIAGAILLGGLLFWIAKRSRAAKAVSAATTPADKPLSTVPQANKSVYPLQPGPNDRPIYFDPSGQDLASSYPLKQNTPATFLPMTPVAHVPPQQLQSMHEQMQALQFSSHPRPNFVTTAHGEESKTSNL